MTRVTGNRQRHRHKETQYLQKKAKYRLRQKRIKIVKISRENLLLLLLQIFFVVVVIFCCVCVIASSDSF